MVKFAWSWADYEREKRAEERRAQPAPDKNPQKKRAAKPAPQSREHLQFCRSCGKHVLAPCAYGGCPIL